MSESIDDTVVTGPGRGVISDGFGVRWTINEDSRIVADGVLNVPADEVEQIAFVEGAIWRQTKDDLLWSWKARPDQAWSHPTEVSPLPGPVSGEAQIVQEDKDHTKAILHEINALRRDFDTWKEAQPPAPTPTQIMDALNALRDDLDKRESSESTQVSTLSGLCVDMSAAQDKEHHQNHRRQVEVLALLERVLDGQAAATAADAAAATADRSDHAVLVSQLNAIQTAITENQAVVVALLTQLVDAVTGPGGLVPIEVAVSGMQASIATILADVEEESPMITEILTDVQQILARLKPVDIVANLDDATHTPQAIPPKG